MAALCLRVDLSQADSDYRPLALLPGTPLLDPAGEHTRYQILRKWLGEVVAEPHAFAEGVGYWVRLQNGHRLVDVRCRPLSESDVSSGPMATEVERLRTTLSKIVPEPDEMQLLTAARQSIERLVEPGGCRRPGDCLFKYRDPQGKWRLVWAWGYARKESRPGRPQVCPQCSLLFVHRAQSPLVCRACGWQPAASRVGRRLAQGLTVAALIAIAVTLWTGAWKPLLHKGGDDQIPHAAGASLANSSEKAGAAHAEEPSALADNIASRPADALGALADDNAGSKSSPAENLAMSPTTHTSAAASAAPGGSQVASNQKPLPTSGSANANKPSSAPLSAGGSAATGAGARAAGAGHAAAGGATRLANAGGTAAPGIAAGHAGAGIGHGRAAYGGAASGGYGGASHGPIYGSPGMPEYAVGHPGYSAHGGYGVASHGWGTGVVTGGPVVDDGYGWVTSTHGVGPVVGGTVGDLPGTGPGVVLDVHGVRPIAGGVVGPSVLAGSGEAVALPPLGVVDHAQLTGMPLLTSTPHSAIYTGNATTLDGYAIANPHLHTVSHVAPNATLSTRPGADTVTVVPGIEDGLPALTIRRSTAVSKSITSTIGGVRAESTDNWFESIRPLGATQTSDGLVVQLEVQGESTSGGLEYRVVPPDGSSEGSWTVARQDGARSTAVVASTAMQLDSANAIRQLLIEARNPRTQQSARYPYAFKVVLDVRSAN